MGKKYKQVLGTECDFQHPQKYSEKMQWLKLYDDNLLRTELTDKVAVRSLVSERIGEKYLIPLIGIYDKFEDIDFEKLLEKFVIKLNHGLGWNIVVKNKAKADLNEIKNRINYWIGINYAYWNAFEIRYASITPKIVIEQYIEDKYGVLNDYKFLCFDGEVKYFWIDFDRYGKHKRNVYELNWNLQPWSQRKYGNYDGKVDKPDNFDEMLSVVKVLCQGFRHVRVDLYNVDGKIYFGEMTFTNGSGYEGIYPEMYEYMLGELIKLVFFYIYAIRRLRNTSNIRIQHALFCGLCTLYVIMISESVTYYNYWNVIISIAVNINHLCIDNTYKKRYLKEEV